MSKTNKVVFVTGSRADYGIMRRYLDRMNRDTGIALEILATGALLDERYGHQVELIYADGFRVAAEIAVPLDSSGNSAVLHTMAVAMDGFGAYFEQNVCDLLIILGDRYEMLPVAVAAAMQKIPILHIHGGEATYANYDEFIRHSITKMSLYHFTATEEYRRRVIQLGEAPDRVFNLGALGAENCRFIEMQHVPASVKELPDKRYFVVLFHPETLSNADVLTQIQEVLRAVDGFAEYDFVFLGTNADTHSDVIRKTVGDYVSEHQNAHYYENLHTDAYHYLLKHAVCLVGNSSSGIIEAPSLGIYTVNIGDRQKGRVRGNSVIDVVCCKENIRDAMQRVLRILPSGTIDNPYYQENAAERYYEQTKLLLARVGEEAGEPKIFYDL